MADRLLFDGTFGHRGPRPSRRIVRPMSMSPGSTRDVALVGVQAGARFPALRHTLAGLGYGARVCPGRPPRTCPVPGGGPCPLAGQVVAAVVHAGPTADGDISWACERALWTPVLVVEERSDLGLQRTGPVGRIGARRGSVAAAHALHSLIGDGKDR